MLTNLDRLPLDPIFKVLAEYHADENPQKVNLGIGLYADEQGKPYVFPSVKAAFERVDRDNFNYQPISGNRDFLEAAAHLVIGEVSDPEELALQTTCGGTQACRMFADLMLRDAKQRTMYIGTPTWGNHFAVFGGLNIERFDHLTDNGEINVAAYQEAVETMPVGSILLLHGGRTHNPTGRNLLLSDLETIVPQLKAKEIVVFMDLAYLGFGDGYIEDRKYAEILFKELDYVACGVSFSKNASLYEHRTGCLMVKTPEKLTVESHLQNISRQSISMAPGLGQEIMLDVLTNHRSEWLDEVEAARESLEMRKRNLLKALPEEFQTLADTRGMFGLLPFSTAQIDRLKTEYSVYMPGNARINFGGLQVDDLAYLAEAFNAVS